ncbi:ABC transporter substrate-binding protein [Desulfobacterales bacterium HSG2]|nr:ABC transporter substrate-binding protein [Desulfobacterales bacterium HSG2]
MKNVKSVIISLVIFLVTPVCVRAGTYTAGIFPHISFAHFVVADEKGFYKEEGVEVDTLQYEYMSDWILAMENNKMNFSATWTSTHMDMYLKGLNAVQMGLVCFNKEGHDRLVVKKGMTPEKLKGKPVAICADYFGIHYIVYDYLRSHNVRFSEVRVVEMNEESAYENFIKGRVQAIVVVGDYISMAVKNGNGVVVPWSEAIVNACMGAFVNFRKKTSIPEADLKKVMCAWLKSLRWYNDPSNDKELRAILTRRFRNNLVLADIADDEHYRATRKRQQYFNDKDLLYYNTHFIRDVYEKILKARKDIGYPGDVAYNYEDMVNTGIMLEVLKEMK